MFSILGMLAAMNKGIGGLPHNLQSIEAPNRWLVRVGTLEIDERAVQRKRTRAGEDALRASIWGAKI